MRREGMPQAVWVDATKACQYSGTLNDAMNVPVIERLVLNLPLPFRHVLLELGKGFGSRYAGRLAEPLTAIASTAAGRLLAPMAFPVEGFNLFVRARLVNPRLRDGDDWSEQVASLPVAEVFTQHL